MPAEQKGSIYKTKRRGFAVRWLENGKRLHQSGFRSRTDARNYFRDEVRPRLDTASTTIDPAINLEDFVKLYLTAHALNVETSTLGILTSRLNAATKTFGKVELRKLERKAPEIAAWRATLADGSRFGATQALRQCLEQAISWGVIQRNPAKLAGKNPQPKRAEVVPFTADELDRVYAELGPHAPIVRFAAATGTRPSEWIALERRDIDRENGIAIVQRSYSRGTLRPYGKTQRSRRSVPLSRMALDALAAVPPRIDSPLAFPSPSGGLIDLHNWRAREWKPALEAAGIGHGTIYTLRHTFATNAIAAGIGLFELARYMGTSVDMLDRVYGHLVVGAEHVARAKLDAAAGRSGV
jgi:integrase